VTELPSEDLQSLMDGIGRLYSHRDLETFPAHLLQLIRKLVPGDSVPYEECDPVRKRTVGIQDPTDARPSPEHMVVWEQHVHEHPVIAHWQRTGTDGTLAISDLITREQWHKTGLYSQMMRKFEVEDQLGMLIADRPPLVLALAVNRSRRGFSDRDKQIFSLLRPHVAEAYHNCEIIADLKLKLDQPRDEDCGGQGMIVLDFDGRISSVDARARRLCTRYFSSWGRAPLRLPPRLWNWLTGEIARAKSESCALAARQPMTVTGPGGKLTARLLNEQNAPGFVLLLSEQRQSQSEAWLDDPAIACLAPRLRRVLEKLLSGLSEKQISLRLELSQHTVHEYVKGLYKELGVSSRAELLARFVRKRQP
jgi:DNA-binding CsgD family transcriptional regulator